MLHTTIQQTMAASSICSVNERMAQHRLMYKCKTPPWKDKYRQRCRDRLKEARDNLLRRFRQLPDSCRVAYLSTVQQVMNDEWNKMEESDEQCLESKQAVDVSAPADYEVNSELCVLDDIQKELLCEEEELWALYAEEMEDSVLCPVCERNFMVHSASIISCVCGVRLNVEVNFTLQHLNRLLKSGLEEHNQRCPSTPCFSYTEEYGIQNLIMTCVACDDMYIVI